MKSIFEHYKNSTFFLSVLLVFSFALCALQSGAVEINWNHWSKLFAFGHSLLSSEGIAHSLDGETYVLWYLRIPRVLLGVLIGASLGLSGALVQGLFRNPLADPSLLGVTTGAACAAALTIVLISEQSILFSFEARGWLLPLVSFMGAFLTCMFLNLGASWLTRGSIAGLLLLGIALNALGMAVIGLCTYLATDEQLRSLSFWTLGSLAGANWTIVPGLGLVLVAVYLWCRTQAQQLNALNLGEATAASLGVLVPRLRWTVSLMVALLAGLSVAFCGVIGFIGLIAPHLARALVGADMRALLPISMLLGALLMLTADTLARTIVIPAEIPVGIFTALLGGPFLMLLIHTKRHRVG
jgi:iron complex transport system permease protein